MGQFSLTHLLLLAIVALIFFGPSRLPQLGQSLGRAIRGFKQGLSGDGNDNDDESPKNRLVGSNDPDRLPEPENHTAARTHTKATQKDPNQQG